jgi:hypothetical protein
LIVIVAALAAKFAVLLVTLISTAATWTGVPLEVPLVVTTAVRFPAAGLTANATVREVVVAAVTTPAAPLLKATLLFEAVASNPIPLIVIVAVLGGMLVVLLVTVGDTVATCTGAAVE